jgi:hypothetical protein
MTCTCPEPRRRPICWCGDWSGGRELGTLDDVIAGASMRGKGRRVWVHCQLVPSWGRSGERWWPGEVLRWGRTWAWVAVAAWRPTWTAAFMAGPIPVDVRRVRGTSLRARRGDEGPPPLRACATYWASDRGMTRSLARARGLFLEHVGGQIPSMESKSNNQTVWSERTT